MQHGYYLNRLVNDAHALREINFYFRRRPGTRVKNLERAVIRNSKVKLRRTSEREEFQSNKSEGTNSFLATRKEREIANRDKNPDIFA